MGWTPDTASVARRLVLAAAALAAFAVPAGASPCISAALRAEETWGLPPRLLLAIGIVESGLDPNALNAEGTPMRPATAAEAVAVVRTLRADGVRSIDTGCFQVNLKWHPQAFATLEEAFVPDRNAHYAARHLADLYGEAGSWTEAVGLYHSADRDRQDLYRAKGDRRGAGPARWARPGPGNSHAGRRLRPPDFRRRGSGGGSGRAAARPRRAGLAG